MHRLSAVTSVRCLGCGTVYGKPRVGGTADSNPGCPKCGYVGWVLDEDRIRAELAQHRSDADQRPRRFSQSS
jgi:predicted  nucleic acid-binding Zn-ribbon protein